MLVEELSISPFELLSALLVSEELSRSLVDSREVLLSELEPLGVDDDEGSVISSFSPQPVKSAKEKSKTAARRIETIFFIKVAPLPIFSEIRRFLFFRTPDGLGLLWPKSELLFPNSKRLFTEKGKNEFF